MSDQAEIPCISR